MPRKPRLEVAGGVHHVWARGNRRQPIYLDDSDREDYLAKLAAVVERQEWNCLSYCLMGNHLHLLLETPKPNLWPGMQRLHGGYARYFNRRHRHVGHLFQDRFRARLIENDAQLLIAAMYVALNPVVAGLCEAPEQWRWSSHSAIARGEEPAWLNPQRLLGTLAAAGGDPRRRYVRLLSA
jgi:putative transposase